MTIVDGMSNSVLATVKTKKSPFALAVNSESHVAVGLSLDGNLTVIDGTTLTTLSPSSPKGKH